MERRVLVIDDNAEMLAQTQKAWAEHGYAQHCVKTGEGAVGALAAANKSGKDIRMIALVADYLSESLIPMVKLVRHISDLPLLILTTEYNVDVRNEAFHLGADRYLPIPETLDEGIVSGLALIRVSERLIGKHQDNNALLLPNDFYINKDKRQVFVNGHEIRLTRKEFDLLWYFSLNRNITLSYEVIYERVWGEEYYADANRTLWSTTKHLRDKLSAASTTHDFIKSERFVGYRFDY